MPTICNAGNIPSHLLIDPQTDPRSHVAPFLPAVAQTEWYELERASLVFSSDEETESLYTFHIIRIQYP